MLSRSVAPSETAGTTREVAGVLRRAAFLAALLCANAAQGQAFLGAPVVFGPSVSNATQTQTVNIRLGAASTIRSISIPLGFVGSPEFILLDEGGCKEDGITINPTGTVCALAIRFRPAAAGLRRASLVITDGAGNATAFGLTGYGYYPQAAITPGTMKVIAGLGPGVATFSGDGSEASAASLNSPQGIAADSFGNIYVADTGNNVVRMLDAFGNITTVAGGGSAVGLAGEGGLATDAKLSKPTYIAVDAAGNLYISDTGNNVVRRVAMSTSRQIITVAGSYSAGFSGDGATATAAQLNSPAGIVIDGVGNLFLVDSGNQRVREVDSGGTISTLAGTGDIGFDASSVAASQAKFSAPTGLAMDAAQNLYVSDAGNHAVRKIADGLVTVVAGTGAAGTSGDAGAASAATLMTPAGLAISAAGDVYIVDADAGVIRKVQASDGIIETVAGGANDAGSYTGGVAPSTSTHLNHPLGIGFDSRLYLFIADTGNNVVRELTTAPGELLYTTQATGSTSAPLTFKIGNIGSAPLSLVNVAAANGATSASFSLANSATAPCNASVASGSHCEYTVAFAPAVSGFAAGEIDVTHLANNPNFNQTEPVYLAGGVIAPISIGPATLPAAIPNVAYSSTVTASGGYGVLTLTTSGNLPPGITPSITGGVLTLSGTPTTTGTYTFTVYANDVLGETATQAYTLQVTPAPLSYALVETVHISDTTADLPGLALALDEAVHVSDAVFDQPELVLALTEAVHVADSSANLPGLVLAVNEAVHVSDLDISIPELQLAVAEFIHVTDAVGDLPQLALTVAETIHVADDLQSSSVATLSLTPIGGALPNATVNLVYSGATISVVGGISPIALTVTGAIPGIVIAKNGSAVTLAGTPTGVGTFSFSVAATDATSASVSQTYTLTVGKQPQSIDAPNIPSHFYGDTAFAVTATSTSGLPVRITVASGPATIVNGAVDLTGAGSVTLDFNQPGNANTLQAKTVQRTFVVAPALATVTSQNASRMFEAANPAFTYAVAGLVHGDSATALTGTPALSTSAKLNSLGGPYPITVAQGSLSSANYTFNFVPGTLTVSGHTPQTITFGKLPSVPLETGTLTLTAHSTSSLAVTYTVTGPATLSGNQLHVSGTGTITVTASQTGDATFDPAVPVSHSFTVTP